MSSEMWIALFSLIGTLLGTIGGIIASNKLTAYRIEELEKKVDKHNNLISRVYNLEAHRDLVDEKIEVANHRISDLEHKGVS